MIPRVMASHVCEGGVTFLIPRVMASHVCEGGVTFRRPGRGRGGPAQLDSVRYAGNVRGAAARRRIQRARTVLGSRAPSSWPAKLRAAQQVALSRRGRRHRTRCHKLIDRQ
eukprot:721099-Hanusia_phi.AAC.2